MAVRIFRGKADDAVQLIADALEQYLRDHADAEIDVYRQDRFSIRVRVIDPSFAKLQKSERHARVWSYLDNVPEEAQSDVSMLVVITPDEAARSIANIEFEDPVPSTL
jgi:hypothetical protein